MHLHTIIAASLVIGLSAPAAFAERNNRPSAAERFSLTDTNGDGYLSQAEIKVVHDKHVERRAARTGNTSSTKTAADVFAASDTNGDGKISQTEAQTMHDKRKARRGNKRSN